MSEPETQTPEIVAKFLRLDRAIGDVVEFIGFDRASLSAPDQKDLDAALDELNAAQADMQVVCYKIGGVS